MQLAEKMSRIGTESAFEVLVKARALEKQGKSIIHLEIGEPDFPTPAHVIEAGKRALDEGWTKYGPTPGLPEFRELIAAYVSGLNRCRYCHGVHTATAERMGVEVGLLPRILRDGDLVGVDAKLRPILTLARKLTAAPDSVTRADAQAVFGRLG